MTTSSNPPASSPAGVTVETRRGKLRGLRQDGALSFRGIPFAQPPVGDLRWRAPRPPLPWDEVRDATAPGNAAQRPAGSMSRKFAFFGGDYDLPRSEDCLYLNVWTPAL